ncbi:TIGR04255 family protein [Nitrospira sp. BLG_2]|uniref:TIGR04255 family protein n=1 Tax=Nitrospira sp. BLG_2 TaxID=3397507 RepID=UPI003B9A62ED
MSRCFCELADCFLLMSDRTTNPLPDYERPPVIEVVYGVQFSPLPELRTPLIGLFWQAIKADYPKFKEMPVLAPVIERFDQEAKTEQPTLELLQEAPLPRLFFLDAQENWVMQVQSDRFLHNWKRVTDDDIYPRFNVVSQKFFQAWERFSEFCRSENISKPKLNQLELTYINHIPVHENHTIAEEITGIFPDIVWRKGHDFLPIPESLSWKTSFLLPNRLGRLHVSLRQARRIKDNAPTLLFELTARGIPGISELDHVKEWFALSREWIVRGFSDLTNSDVQKTVWNRKA